MEAAQIRDNTLPVQKDLTTKKLAKGEHNEAARVAAHEPVESAADVSREAAGEALNEKPMQQRHEQHIENDLRGQQQDMLSLGRREKAGEEERILRSNPQLKDDQAEFVGEQPHQELLDAELKRIDRQDIDRRENPQLFRKEQEQRFEREDLGTKIEDEKEKVDIEQPEAKNKKHQHKKLSSKQLQKHQQELEETENVHQTQKREQLPPNSPSSSSGDSAEKELRFEQHGREELGDIQAKQVAHTEPHHKKQRDRASEGEQPHLTAQQLKHQNLKDQQAPAGLHREGRSKVRHHPKPDAENPRIASPSSTTSSSGSEEVAHAELHELVNKNLPRDQIHDQERLKSGGKLQRLQEAQQRQQELPTKSKQSEDDKRMSTSIGQQLPAKQEATAQEQKTGSKLLPSQKKDHAPAQ